MAKEGGWSCGQQVHLRGVLASSVGAGANPVQVPDSAPVRHAVRCPAHEQILTV